METIKLDLVVRDYLEAFREITSYARSTMEDPLRPESTLLHVPVLINLVAD